MLGLLVWLGLDQGFTWPWYTAVAAAATLFAFQQVIIRDRGREACFRAFTNNNWVGLAIFAGFVGHFLVQ